MVNLYEKTFAPEVDVTLIGEVLETSDRIEKVIEWLDQSLENMRHVLKKTFQHKSPHSKKNSF